ncbi:MAG: efflux RND transporter periplasmic adaptor subunit [Deltaproteobacteria bacterium]|nr:efflux RND transporter periplasmic adaptor subunit [Deltaproteobacteria bacterium]
MRNCIIIMTMCFVGAVILGCEQRGQTRQLVPPEVVVSHPTSKDVTEFLEFTGITAALESVEIRARVKGWLQSVNFQPGAKVKKGDLLFLIDPRMFQAQVDQYQAQLEGKKADLNLQETNMRRAEQLLGSASISQLQYDTQRAQDAVAKAQVGISEADLERTKLDLEYARVTAPIDGNASRNLVDAGNLVGAGNETLLTKIVNESSVYAYFNLSERDALKLKKMTPPENSESGERTWKIKVYLALSDETGFPHEGKIDYWEPELDPKTGTLQARAIFSNENGLLMPGLFARVRVPVQKENALLVPELAVGVAQAGMYVLVVNKDNVVEQRLVKTGQLDGVLRIIGEGLKQDDWVIVNGIQRARPGAKVNPQKAPEEPRPSQPPKQVHSPPK